MAAWGFGVVERDGRTVSLVEHGWLRTPAGDRLELRLKQIYDDVAELLARFEPESVAIEESYVGANPRTALSVGQARGAVLVACAAAGVACVEYPPATIKQAVCGYGRADKTQVQRMVRAILRMETEPRPDHASDALAVAICHALDSRSTPAPRGGGPMIARLRGRPVALDADGLILDVNGVGYRVLPTASAIRKADGREEVTIETHLHVREDALQLFGFAAVEERQLFEQLLSVAGIGPKVALAIVSAYAPADLRRAIASGDTALFESIPGIGRKLAQRVVLELKEKIGLAVVSGGPPVAGAGDGHLVARDALVELGFTPAEAEQRLASVDPDLPPSERVVLALRAA